MARHTWCCCLPRALKNALLYPVEVALLYVAIPFAAKNKDRLLRGR